MDCEQARLLLNASLDGELDLFLEEPAERAALDAHLAECANCRSDAEFFERQHSHLQRGFLDSRQAAIAATSRLVGQWKSPAVAPRRSYFWLGYLASTAAGFLIAVFAFRPAEPALPLPVSKGNPQEVRRASKQAPPVARLVLATGPVEVRQRAGSQAVNVLASGALKKGATVSTGPAARCELEAADGSVMRLNLNSELRLSGARRVALARGQLWSSVDEGDEDFSVSVPQATVCASQGEFDLRCDSGTTVLTVVRGAVKCRDSQAERTVSDGEQLTLVDGQFEDCTRTMDPLLATSWVNDLLALKGPDNPELARRMHDILAQLGDAKLSYMYEDEIRRQGDQCVPPLVEYLKSALSKNDAAENDDRKRVIAAEIIADVAQPRSIPDLIALLNDDRSDVRAAAARGLLRLTGRDQGRSVAQWQTDPPAASIPTQVQWRQWWAQNKHRYPGTRRIPDSFPELPPQLTPERSGGLKKS